MVTRFNVRKANMDMITTILDRRITAQYGFVPEIQAFLPLHLITLLVSGAPSLPN